MQQMPRCSQQANSAIWSAAEEPLWIWFAIAPRESKAALRAALHDLPHPHGCHCLGRWLCSARRVAFRMRLTAREGAVSLEQVHNFKTTYRDRTLSYLLRVR